MSLWASPFILAQGQPAPGPAAETCEQRLGLRVGVPACNTQAQPTVPQPLLVLLTLTESPRGPGLTPASRHQDYRSVPLPLPTLPSRGPA